MHFLPFSWILFTDHAISKHIVEDLESTDKNWKANRDAVKLNRKIGKIIENHATATQLSVKCYEKKYFQF